MGLEAVIGLIGALALGLGVGAAIVQIWGSHQNGRIDLPVTKDICIVKHAELDKRLSGLRESMTAGFDRMDHNLDRIYDRLETQPGLPPSLGQHTRRKDII